MKLTLQLNLTPLVGNNSILFYLTPTSDKRDKMEAIELYRKLSDLFLSSRELASSVSLKSWWDQENGLRFFITNAPRSSAPSTSTRRPFLPTTRPAGREVVNRGRAHVVGVPGGVNPVVPAEPALPCHVAPLDPPEESPDDHTEPEESQFSPPLTRGKKKRKIRKRRSR